MRPETKYALSGDVYIAYQVIGEGPPVIMAPGTMSHLDLDWESPVRAAFFEKFGAFCRLVRFDKRGTGLSDRPLRMATLEERSDDIRAVMDAEGLEVATIFGASEGGSMACMFAATHPDRVRSLIIWGAQAKWTASDDHPWGQTREENDELLAGLKEGWPSVAYITGWGAGLGEDADPALIDTMMRYMRAAASPSAVYAYEQMNFEIDTRPILPSIRVPTLVMNRKGDPVARAAAARDMASRIPGARYLELPGDTHSLMIFEPEAVLAEIEEFVTGVRPVIVTDRILATVLFIDLVGSTEKASSLGDTAWRDQLNAYYSIVRKQLAKFRGNETNNAGDGFLATFDGPARAIQCALAISDEVRQLGLETRSGVHTGECELMGDNVGGIAVHIGARVMAKADPSGVVVSSTVKDLVSGSGISFGDLGFQTLKGVPDEWRLYAVER